MNKSFIFFLLFLQILYTYTTCDRKYLVSEDVGRLP